MAHELPMDTIPSMPASAEKGLLQGFRVIDLTTSIAGPYATMLLADFGAEVIKVERPGGDDARQWGPPFLDGESLWFLSVNRNKKSVVLDLNAPDGQEALRALIRSGDVFVTNQPPRVQEKLGLDAASVSALNPEIIFTSITGFGLNGDRRDLPCYDLISEGYSGIMDITGAADSDPQKIGAPAADMLAGQDAAMATIAALLSRQTSGGGHVIDVALVESMTRFLAPRISSYLGSGEVPRRSGGTDSVIAIYQSFDTADLPLTLGLGTDAIWRRFCEVLGWDGRADDPRYRSNADRRALRAEIVADIAKALLAKTRAEWLEIFEEARIPAGPINAVDEVTNDPCLQERGLIYALEAGDRRIPQIGLGIQIDGRPTIARSAPPKIGEHTEDVLSGLQGAPNGAVKEREML